jgi:hypothetical protein
MNYIENIIIENKLSISVEELEEIIIYNKGFSISVFETLQGLEFDYISIKNIMKYYELENDEK